MALTIEKSGDGAFKVTVVDTTTTTHVVTVSQDYWRKLTGGRVPPEKLVEKSFEFLLERESGTSILRMFDLAVIQRYFPEYESRISSMLA